MCFTHRCFFGTRIRRVQHIKPTTVKMRRRKAVRDDDHLLVGCILRDQHLPSEPEAVLNVCEVRVDHLLG